MWGERTFSNNSNSKFSKDSLDLKGERRRVSSLFEQRVSVRLANSRRVFKFCFLSLVFCLLLFLVIFGCFCQSSNSFVHLMKLK